MKVAGTFNGTGAAVYICCGFVPDYVRIISLEDGDIPQLEWFKQMRAAEMSHGLHLVESTSATQQDARTAGDGGILPYPGGDLLTTITQTSVGYGEGVYLGWDHKNYALDEQYGYASDPLITWTLDTLGNRTGHANDDSIATVARIGEGSLILIEEDSTKRFKWATVEVWAAGNGAGDDEITLSEAVASGKIHFISGMYSMAPIPVGNVAPAGFKVEMTSDLNANDEIQMFIAESF
jgi:hypothetical protein